MQAQPDQIEVLLELSKLDRAALSAQKKLEGLPQRAQILTLRKKREAILDKRKNVEQMRKAAERDLARISDEDSSLAEKQTQIQATIDACHGDFRSVEAHTKELNGVAKRRSTLEEQLVEVDARLSKIKGVEEQISTLLASIEKEEATAIESFKRQGGDLKAIIEAARVKHEKQLEFLPDELSCAYEKAAKRCGGVALGLLEGNTCSVCRSVIDEPHLIELRTHAPIGECPSCKRLLVISQSE